VQIHKRYSENVVLDAILQDLANICEENQIRLTEQLMNKKKEEHKII
jgi:hypothetical protein